ncbi:sugar phosphate isomerase/epimerase family protein [Mycobacterium sp. 29Ha]|uniref:sugar phosphate isomerase/epimerase family protein n=1 Tax=Mycobacterium sp. 29Ha TaxID=2939268 RepID=UPI002939427A|nr:TIM barrel protein [Mycobacterium sp. 29Ha]MDV3130584.1 sugar phosphate isomerase/epimerase [Mycobacterium sp. 29Ha]
MHSRLSVHSVTFLGTPLPEQHSMWSALGLTRLSLIDSQLGEPGLVPLIEQHGYSVDTVYHLFESGDQLSRVIENAAALGTRVVYMLTGGRGELDWGQAAERFCAAVAPCLREAEHADVALAIENASALYADIHIAHTLRDTITLAEMAGVGVCIDLFHCWAEADLGGLVERALPRTLQIQLSDYVLGDRALPARAVPGDGTIPIEPFIRQVLAGGYSHGFDLELIGPRIEAEGRFEAVRRGCEMVSTMLKRLGA